MTDGVQAGCTLTNGAEVPAPQFGMWQPVNAVRARVCVCVGGGIGLGQGNRV